jgi:hypothetical protein
LSHYTWFLKAWKAVGIEPIPTAFNKISNLKIFLSILHSHILHQIWRTSNFPLFRFWQNLDFWVIFQEKKIDLNICKQSFPTPLFTSGRARKMENVVCAKNV